jgi:Zn-dependent protease with chaperone function
MNELSRVVLQCLATGTVFTSVCGALVVPPLVWLVIRLVAPTITRMRDDRSWQAFFAAASAALPGFTFLVLATAGLVDGVHSACLQLTAGKILFGALSAAMIGAILRSIVRAEKRRRELKRMLADSQPARGWAREIAAFVGVTLFEIFDDEQIVVIAAAAPAPAVYISRAALRQFDEAELRAALYHERAHLKRGDHRIAGWLYFLTELLPLPVDDLIAAYRCSREFCADRCALQHVDRTDLAAALLRVARGRSSRWQTAAAFAEHDAIRGRLDALLRPTVPEAPNIIRRWYIGVTLSAIVLSATVMPLAATILLSCHQSGFMA